MARSIKGSKPGDALADAMWSFFVLPIPSDVEADLGQAGVRVQATSARGLVHMVGDNRGITCNVTYADDTGVAAEPRCNDTVLDDAKTVVGIVATRCQQRALKVNWKYNKSGVLLYLKGKLSKQIQIPG